MQICNECPHYGRDDSRMNENDVELVYCSLKGEYCIDDGSCEICTERQNEIKHQYDFLDERYPSHFRSGVQWLESHDFRKEKETVYHHLYPYKKKDGKIVCLVHVYAEWNGVSWSVRFVGTSTYSSGGMSDPYFDVREALMESDREIQKLVEAEIKRI